MKFIEKFELETPNGPQQGKAILVDGTLLVGETVIGSYSEGDSEYEFRPAYYDGRRGFLKTEHFAASERGNSAEWTDENFVPLRDGIEMLLNHGQWDWLVETQ